MEDDKVDKIIKKWDQVGGLEGKAKTLRITDSCIKFVLDVYSSSIENLLIPLDRIQSKVPASEKDCAEYLEQVKEISEIIYSLIHDALKAGDEILYLQRDNTLHGL